MLVKYKAVIFDYDDTLVKTFETVWKLHQKVAKQFYGRDITREDVIEVWGMPHEEMVFKLYGENDSIENMLKNKEKLRHMFPKSPHKGAIELIQKLGEEGRFMGIVTAMLGEFVKGDMVSIGFPVEYINFIQGSEHTEFHKPDPKVFDPVLIRLQEQDIDVDQTVYIGDAIRDFQAAKGANIDFIGVANGLTSIVEFESVGAQSVANLDDLLG